MDAAWDVQAFLEETIPEGRGAVVVLLDYAKFFDSFGYAGVSDLLLAIGFDPGIVGMIIKLNGQLQRHCKINGR